MGAVNRKDAVAESYESNYTMPDNLFGWLNARVGRKVYVKTKDGQEWAGRISFDAPGILRLTGFSFDTRLYESAIVGVEDAADERR